jgi:AcrR family transcriptional regulator
LVGQLRGVLERRLGGLPAEVDAILDAAGRCFARRGVDHTSVPDIAREAGVSRSTVYRLLGGVEDIAGTLFARDVDRVLAALPPELSAARGPRPIVDIASAVLHVANDHPVTSKVRKDEPYVLGALLPRLGALPAVGRALAPVLADGMAAGELRPGDPEAMADAIARLVLIGFLVPPPDIDDYLRGVLLPLLQR